MHKSLLIEYANSTDSITLEFALRDNPVVERWIERVNTAQASYPIDDPARFYGFGTESEQITNALIGINKCIETVNSHKRIINRVLLDIRDQDTLNYLHHIFEVHHGLLDRQTGDYWSTAPASARRALADLNIWVHRCETAGRGAEPRHVVTWFGLPKDHRLLLLCRHLVARNSVLKLCGNRQDHHGPGRGQRPIHCPRSFPTISPLQRRLCGKIFWARPDTSK
jgi:hypothetical protein